MSSIYESNVDPLRPNDAHGISLQLVGKEKRVLELGAASGHVTLALKQLGNEVTAIERDGRFRKDLEAVADHTHITDLDWLDLRTLLKGETYDVILAGDVLEHCSRPDLVLLQCHSLLRRHGYVVISIPNIAHADVRLALLAGRFEYRPTGLLDQTHLRFFTRKTLEQFVTGCGFEVETSFASTAPLGGTEFGPPDSSIPREAIDFVQQDRDSTVYQYIVKIRPATPLPEFSPVVADESDRAQLLAELSLTLEALAFTRSQSAIQSTQTEEHRVEVANLHDEISRLSEQLNTVTDELNTVTDELNTVTDELRLERTKNTELQMKLLNARDAVIGAAADLGTMRAKFETARVEVDSLVNQLNLLHTSRTWRIGRFVLLPLRGVRWIIKKLLG